MLADEIQELISAALDRELTSDETRQVRDLLRTSPEARALYEQLKADRDRLRGLLPVPPPPNLHDRIMGRLPGIEVRPTPAAPATDRSRLKRFRIRTTLALAASVLLAITAASFLHFSQEDVGSSQSVPLVAAKGVVPNTPKESPPGQKGLPSGDRDTPLPAPRAIEPPHEAVALAPEPNPASTTDQSIPPPRAVEAPPRDALAFPPLSPVDPFDLVEVRIPFLASVSDLGREDVRKALLEELGRDPAYRIDLFTADPGRAVELIRGAARSEGLNVLSDQAVAERIKRKQGTSYLLYVECLTAAEVHGLLSKIAAADARTKMRQFDKLHMAPLGASDLKELKEVLGIDPGLSRKPEPAKKQDALPDPKKPISSGTADKVANNLTSPGKSGQKVAALLTFGPHTARSHPSAPEFRKFLSLRGERKPDAVPLMIVIR